MKKRILLVLVLLAILVTPVFSGDKDNEWVEVNIVVKYNAVSTKEAQRIIYEALRDHRDACKVEVSGKKVETDGWVTTGSTAWITIPSD